MGGRGSRSGMVGAPGGSQSPSQGGSGSNFDVSGRININPKDFPLGSGVHSYSEGTVYFGTKTNKSQLLDYAENGNFTSRSDGSKTLSFDLVGSITSSDYPSGNLMAAGATIRKTSSGSFSLSYPRPSGTQTDKVYKTESAAENAGRNALKKFINKQYGNK